MKKYFKRLWEALINKQPGRARFITKEIWEREKEELKAKYPGLVSMYDD